MIDYSCVLMDSDAKALRVKRGCRNNSLIQFGAVSYDEGALIYNGFKPGIREGDDACMGSLQFCLQGDPAIYEVNGTYCDFAADILGKVKPYVARATVSTPVCAVPENVTPKAVVSPPEPVKETKKSKRNKGMNYD